MAKKSDYSSEISNVINTLSYKTEVRDEGSIIALNDNVAFLSGLENVMYGEVISFKGNLLGLILNLENKRIGTLILGDSENLRRGDKAISTGKLLEIGVGNDILGRVIDPLGNPLDDKAQFKIEKMMPIEKIAPSIVDRSPVNMPLQSGIKAIDSMIPIGRGQRELIIGDRGTGKTALAIDTIINQKNTDVICIYVAIGQKRAKIAQVIEKLSEFGVMDKCVIVSASASDPASMRYLAPYSGCAIGEYFMQKGKNCLVVYDDLSKHAWAYREISLLLKRPSGREAYPGDVFYLHSRLLERACQLSKELGSGSLTALPIIETQAGDVSAYIPTNVISITDGQIYLESDLFFSGIRPALNVGLSVSRIGGSAQIKAMKKVSGKLRLDLSQYWELATFAQFATDLDPATKEKIERGKRIIEILKQPRYVPMPIEDQVISIFLVTEGEIDDIPVDYIKDFEYEFLDNLHKFQSKILKEIKEKKTIDEVLDKNIRKLITLFKKDFIVKHSLTNLN